MWNIKSQPLTNTTDLGHKFAVIYTVTVNLLLLLSQKADAHFDIPQKIEG